MGNANRPTTLPGDLAGNRPGSGIRPNEVNRPGVGGNRPGIGGNRPTTLPGDLGNNRPGIGGNRPGIGGNRPGIGNGNGNFSGNLSGNSFNNVNVNGGGWGYGGFGGGGYGGWGYGGGGFGGGYGGWNNGWVNPRYGSWYNGGCGGYYGGGWGSFAAGAATWGVLSAIGSWGLGYGTLGYGAGGYVNPYYASMPATVVASSPYDYSQPIVVNNYIPSDAVEQDAAEEDAAEAPAEQPATPPSPADAAVDEALAKFKAGDYAGALAGFDAALKLSPKDSVIHEVRALALFALGRYPEAAAALNAVLASAPGMDWTTISNVYGSVDAYTTHLRRLEDVCRTKPDDAAAHFVLAYHYLVGDHSDMAAAALRVVVAKQPGDVVAKRMLEAIEATEPKDEESPAPSSGSTPQKTDVESAAEPSLPETDLVGTWKASSGTDTILLVISEDSKFSWKAQPKDKPAVELAGTIETAADAIALVSKSAGTMVAKVTPKGPDAFEFSLPSAPKDTTPLLFARQR
ncbi:MAG: tetratricopeptide repeat protein [Pirellulales bacterium]